MPADPTDLSRDWFGSTQSEPDLDPSLERVDRLVEEMTIGWRLGEQPSAADFLHAYPDLDDEAAIRLIFEEVLLRREAGLEVVTAEIIGRYPRWRNDLEPLLGFDKILKEPSSAVAFQFPKVRERLGGFQLIHELGRGAAGRTFLAEQSSLADRPVVLKLMATNHNEHLSLARLQHTYIVPLYWEQEFPEFGLRGLVMPYLGGSNLGVVLDDLVNVPVDERSGSDFNDALRRVKGPTEKLLPTEEDRTQHVFDRLTFDQVACWITVCLADALQYAHERGLLHMDVKPSNVLIASDGQPMLLDFHLARPPIAAGAEVHDRLGGTPGWTSPEQEAAMTAVFQGKRVETAIDGRSDVYALGLMLHEMLGGAWDRTSRTTIKRLSACNPSISVGLSDIVNHCLAVDPADRYPTAAALAVDLRCHIEDLPLRGVANRSPLEVLRKWRRRSPFASAKLAIAAAGLSVLFLAYFYWNDRSRTILSWANESTRLWENDDHEEALSAANRGLELSRKTPVIQPYLQRMIKLRNRADWARSADDLHKMADLIRFTYGAISATPSKLHAIAPKLRAVWERRAKLVPPYEATSDADRRLRNRLAIDCQEIAVVLARLRTEVEPKPSALTDALQILDQAERDFGTSVTLALERQNLVTKDKSSQDESAKEIDAKSAWEHYELGRYYLLSHRFEAAAGELHKSLELRPYAFWTNFFDGYCAYQLGRYDDALAAFRVCVTLQPESANVRVNRALAYEAVGKLDEAYQENSRAIALDETLVEAYLNRGHLAYKRNAQEFAIKDLSRALALQLESAAELPKSPNENADRRIEGHIRYLLALALRANGKPAEALNQAKLAEQAGSIESKALISSLRPKR